MQSKHALLSPSSSHRWINCTAAPRLEAEVPSKDTDYTLEGTLAHAYCAMALKQHTGEQTAEEEEVIDELRERYLSPEMPGHVETYRTIVLEKMAKAIKRVADSRLIVEQRLDFTRWIPDSFGTADAIIITDGTLEVIDFKYGKGVEVSAEWNTQMMIYALGAVAEYEDEYNIRSVRMTIVQPRLGNLSEFELEKPALEWWAATVLSPKAKEAMGSETRQNCGDWCRFCRVKNSCAKLAGEALSIADEFGDREQITAEDMAAKVLPRLATIKAWLGSVEEYALEQALKGVSYPGYKLVEGRSIRRITDTEKLADRLMAEGFAETDIFRPKDLRTLTELEKLVGKTAFIKLSDGLVEKPRGKPTLVQESDKRQQINAAEEDFKAFED